MPDIGWKINTLRQSAHTTLLKKACVCRPGRQVVALALPAGCHPRRRMERGRRGGGGLSGEQLEDGWAIAACSTSIRSVATPAPLLPHDAPSLHTRRASPAAFPAPLLVFFGSKLAFSHRFLLFFLPSLATSRLQAGPSPHVVVMSRTQPIWPPYPAGDTVPGSMPLCEFSCLCRKREVPMPSGTRDRVPPICLMGLGIGTWPR